MLGSLMDMLLCWLCWLWTCLFPEASPLYMVNLLRAYIHQHDPQLHPELSELGWGPNTSACKANLVQFVADIAMYAA